MAVLGMLCARHDMSHESVLHKSDSHIDQLVDHHFVDQHIVDKDFVVRYIADQDFVDKRLVKQDSVA